MPRAPRIVIAGLAHHVVQRGNRGQEVFRDDDDRRFYLSLLRKRLARYEVALIAYCLMRNHVHLACIPPTRPSLAALMRDTQSLYATYFNSRHGTTCHLWHARFFSSPLDGSYTWAAVRYIERNPVRAGLVDRAERFPWSSAAGHCGLRRDNLLAPDFPPRDLIADWSVWLHDDRTDDAYAALRSNTRAGKPTGSPAFVSAVSPTESRCT